ncbi:MAG: hypothetical protein D6675_03540 [Gemmatimonadetes bacterium]|nr:MAG: hypothetical protein D6675_03540 [Gemmatimonadota bacterium]
MGSGVEQSPRLPDTTGTLLVDWNTETCFKQRVKLWFDGLPSEQLLWGSNARFELEPGEYVCQVTTSSGSFVWQVDTLTVVRNEITPWHIQCRTDN